MNLFLDSSALIYYFEGAPPQQLAVRQLLGQLMAQYGTAQLAVSRLTVMECMVKPMREQNAGLLATYERYFAGLTIVELTAPVVAAATQIRAQHGLKTPDALLAACALSLGDSVLFVTGDLGFGRVPHLNLKLIALSA